MTSASTIPYNLRVKKMIDRNIFLDLLQRTCAAAAPEGVVYISMGGAFVQDHADVHAALGLTNLVSFDADAWVVERQQFNRPVSCIRCLTLSTEDVVRQVDSFFGDYVGDKPCVIWFDYTEPERGKQLREVRSLMPMLGHGDVLKVTLNSHVPTLGTPASDDVRGIKEYRWRRLDDQLNEYSPSDCGPDDMTESGLAAVLGKAFAIACDGGVQSEHVFVPLSAFRYADGQQMVTFTGVVVKSQARDEYLERSGLSTWPFRAVSFADISEINVQALSLREKTEIDRLIFSSTAQEVRTLLALSLAKSAAETERLIDDYRKFYRFYPKIVRISAI